MFMRSAAAVLLLATTAAADSSATRLLPELGKPASQSDIAALTRTVFADGEGLPPGSGSVAQGKALYTQHCATCHGIEGQGGTNDALAGGQGSLTTASPVRTIGSYWPYATTIFDYINRAMPYRQPGSLSNDEVYALTAYLLHINGVVDAETTIDADALKRVGMPNRNNFIWAPEIGESP